MKPEPKPRERCIYLCLSIVESLRHNIEPREYLLCPQNENSQRKDFFNTSYLINVSTISIYLEIIYFLYDLEIHARYSI